MELLDEYFKLQHQLYKYFGYKEDLVSIPIDDARNYFWRLNGEGPGVVQFAESERELNNQEGDYYENTIYTQRYLSQWVYRGQDYTMVCVDTHSDGNRFLRVFDNSKERKAPASDSHKENAATEE